MVTWRELCTVDRDGVSIRLKSLHIVYRRDEEKRVERGVKGEDLQVPSEDYCQLSPT